MPLKFVTVNDVFQLLGDFVPQTPYRGSGPGPLRPRLPHLCSSKISFKNPLA